MLIAENTISNKFMEPEIIEIQLDSKYPNLKRQLRVGENIKNLQEVWTKENISDGFKKFYDENGRYPTALEIDSYEYLPSSRQIQRAFGGLVKLRQELGLKVINFGSGENRSRIAKNVNQRGRDLEKEMEKILVDKFGECFVHVEKPLNKYYISELENGFSKNRSDFFVYCSGYEFCVDVFYADNLHNFVSILSMKESNYTGLKIDAYLINMNDRLVITGERMEKYKKSRFNGEFDKRIKIMDKKSFIDLIKDLTPLKIGDFDNNRH